MSSTNQERVLHLQHIDIESAVAPQIRAELRIDGVNVGIRAGHDGSCWTAGGTVEVRSTTNIVLVLRVKTGRKFFKITSLKIFVKDSQIEISGQDALESISASNLQVSRSTSLVQQPVKVVFVFCEPSVSKSEAAYVALQKACDEIQQFRSLIETPQVQQAVDTALKIGVALSEMDPFTKAAFALARVTLELLQEQQKYDTLIPQLAESFSSILPFAIISLDTIAVDYEISELLKDILEDLFDTVEEGARFICQYVRRTSLNRAVVSLVSSEDKNHINDLQDRLAKLKGDFDRVIAVDAWQRAKDSEQQCILKRLKPVTEAIYDPSQGCMKDTRKEVLQKVLEWASDPSREEKILWLHGIPGSGKTSVATSLCDMLHTKKYLAASFFCRRDDPIRSQAGNILPTIIYYLASMWGPYRRLVTNALHADPMLHPNQTQRIFEVLVEKPLQILGNPLNAIEKPLATPGKPPPRPLVIVIDGLDEYGDTKSRLSLLCNLFKAASIVKWLKVVLTSRPERDIQSAFTSLRSNAYQSLDLYVTHDARNDILLFAKENLTSLAKLRHMHDWPNDELLELVVERSRGLFISVQTMWLLLRDERRPDKLLTQVLKGTAANSADDKLYELYTTVLQFKVKPKDCDDFRQIIGAVLAVAARRALCDETLAVLLEIEPHVVKSIVDDLQSLFYREGKSKAPVRARHLSIIDFLLGSSCPGQFRVDIEQVNDKLTTGCFKIMTKELKFNICYLETSYLLSEDVPDMDDRINRISDPLYYSCTQWASHLESAALDATRIGYLQNFMHDQFLFWLEVLSLIKGVGLASNMLSSLIEWMKMNNQDEAMATDLRKFVAVFACIISQSVPHIYLSALPFSPRSSALWKQYMQYYPRTLTIQSGGLSRWPAIELVLWHTSIVMSVAFSADSKRIVSGSGDNTIRVWDAETGAMVVGPLEGHSGSVTSVAFSADSKHIVSGSWDKTIRVWDAETGAMVVGPLEEHSDRVTSVAFSADSKRIVSGSEDKTIRVWDAETGAMVVGPLEGHSGWVTSVAFSADSKRIVSGSVDKTIRVWDAETRAMVVGPLEGHSGWVTSVAFSADSKRIVSGSWDKTIRVWDAETGAMVVGPLEGHSGWVTSVAFSADSKRIVSGFGDKTIRVWDAETGAMVVGPLEGHSGWVSSVAFSADSKRIVSGSDDKTIRVWDAETRAMVVGPLEGHSGWVTSVAFSADSKRIVSGSWDKTIRVWDAETGAMVVGPLEGHSGSVMSVAFSADSKRIVSGSGDETIRVWDAETGAMVVGPLEGHSGSVTFVAFSADSKRLVSGSGDKTIRVWDAETGAMVVGPLEGHSGSVTSVAFSADSKSIVSGSEDETIRVWDAETGAMVVGPLEGHSGWVTSVAFSADSKRIVSGSVDKTIRVWDAETRAMVVGPLEGHSGWVSSVAFSADSTRIVSGSEDETIRVWDAETGAMVVGPLEGHSGSVTSVAFSADSKRIVSGSEDETIRVWDAETGAMVVGPLEGHSESVTSVAFSADSKRIVSGSGDETIRVWDAETGNYKQSIPVLAPFNHSSKMEDGWILGPYSERLFWVPPTLRDGLLRPGNMLLIGTIIATRLDLKFFVHGESWSLCKKDSLSSTL